MFIRVGLPYKVVGGVRFYERREVRDAIAYLRAISNRSDDVSVRRILNVPKRGIGDRAEAAVADLANRERISFGEALRRVDDIAGLATRSANQLRGFVELMDAHEAMVAEGAPADAILTSVLEGSGYLAELQASTDPQDQTRLENLVELVTVAREFVNGVAVLAATDDDGALDAFDPAAELAALTAPAPQPAGVRLAELPPGFDPLDPEQDLAAGAAEVDDSLGAFLERVALVADSDQIPSPDAERAGVVTLMTLHTAKGLEFDNVFLTGCEDGVFPHMRALNDPDELAEERRLAYVGITRARKRLHVSRAIVRAAWGTPQHNPASRFLTEIPDRLVDWRRTEQAVTSLAEHLGDDAGEHQLAQHGRLRRAQAQGAPDPGADGGGPGAALDLRARLGGRHLRVPVTTPRPTWTSARPGSSGSRSSTRRSRSSESSARRQAVHPGRGAAQHGGRHGVVAQPADDAQHRAGHRGVAAGGLRDRPVAADHQPVGAEQLEGVLHPRPEVVVARHLTGGDGVQAGHLGHHLRRGGGPRHQRPPRLPVPGPHGRVPEVVQHDAQRGERRGQVLDVLEVARQHTHEVEGEARGFEEAQAVGHIGPQQPVRVRLVVDEGPHAHHPGVRAELRHAARGPGGLVQRHVGHDAEDARVPPRLRQHRVGVLVPVGGLDQHHAVDAQGVQVGADLVEDVAPAQHGGRVPEPVVPARGRVPEVQVGVDDHGRPGLPATAAGRGRSARRPG